MEIRTNMIPLLETKQKQKQYHNYFSFLVKRYIKNNKTQEEIIIKKFSTLETQLERISLNNDSKNRIHS